MTTLYNNQSVYDKHHMALQTKWQYKKHVHSSINKIYELRGSTGRKINIMVNKTKLSKRSIALYLAENQMVKRVKIGYNRHKRYVAIAHNK